jgi:hypothetical protein
MVVGQNQSMRVDHNAAAIEIGWRSPVIEVAGSAVEVGGALAIAADEEAGDGGLSAGDRGLNGGFEAASVVGHGRGAAQGQDREDNDLGPSHARSENGIRLLSL